MLIRCRQCIWFQDCKKAKQNEDLVWEDEFLECPYYDGLLVISEGLINKRPRADVNYDEEDLGTDDYFIYVEEFGWVKCNPEKVVVK